jgi:S-DNA-T family DNA segregation ATPase FtsK/SpoIIIE
MAFAKVEKDSIILLPDIKNLKEALKKKKEEISHSLALSKELNELGTKWKDIMGETDSFNKEFLTFTLSHISKEDYGYRCRIYAPRGMALEGLEKLKPVIETGLECIFKYDIPDHKEFAMADIIKPLLVKCNDIPFSPYRCKPYELYAGVDIKGEPVVFNINVTPHVLLAGQTRKGKNGSLNHMLISLINSCTEYQVQIYLVGCAKSDLIQYEDCKQVRCCILGDLEQMDAVMDYIVGEVKRRSEVLRPMIKALKGDNIFHYNKQNPKNQMPYIYLVFDEIMELMMESETKAEDNLKASILGKLQKVAQFGGAMGVTYIACHQKPEVSMLRM